MSEFNKYSTDGGATFIDVEDTNGRIMSEQLVRGTVGYTNKNMFFPLYDETDANPVIRGGITYAVDLDDMSVTADGTATTDSWFTLGNTAAFKAQFENGKTYRVSGCPNGGSANTYYIDISGMSKQQTGDALIFDWSSNVSGIFIRVKSGTTISNQKFYPMICEANIQNTDFEGSSPKANDVLQYLCNTVAKNYRPPFLDGVNSGITLVNNADESVTLNGTATAKSEFIRTFLLKKGTYVLFADGENIPTGNNNVWFNINILTPSGNHDLFVNRGHKWKRFTLTQDSTVKTRLFVENGVTVTDMTLYTMVCDVNNSNFVYQPYAKSNKDLTDEINDRITDVYKTMGEMGAKNICPNRNIGKSPYTQAGITVTTHNDGSFTTSAGTLSGSNLNGYLLADSYTIKAGTYVLTGFPTTGIDGQLEIKKKTDDTLITLVNKNTPKNTFTLNEDTSVYIRPWIADGTTLVESDWYPMIYPVEFTDETFTEYAKTNKELTTICRKPVCTDITTAVRTKLGTISYSINQAVMYEDEYRVDLSIWVSGITSGNIDWDLSGIIPLSLGRQGGIIAPREGNPAGLTWINDNAAILCNRFAVTDSSKEFIVLLSYVKK